MKTFITRDGLNKVTRVSRWIKVDSRVSEDGTYLDYFSFNGNYYTFQWVVANFARWCNANSCEFIDTDGKSVLIIPVDNVDNFGGLDRPLYIELDNSGGHVRVYEIERNHR